MNLKKIGGLGLASLSLMLYGANGVKAQELPEIVNTTITINENVKLSHNVTLTEKAKLIILDGKDVTIDLNGYTLSQTTDNYNIDNKDGTLTIIDSANKKGKITCTSTSSSCVRNNKEMTIDGVTINSVYTAVKTEEATSITIKNANITSTSPTAGAFMNWGDATIDNSVIKGSNSKALNSKGEYEYGTSIYSLGYVANGTQYNSTVTINNSTISGYYAVFAKNYYDEDNTTQTVKINGGTIIQSAENNDTTLTLENNSILEISGEVEAPIEAMNYAKEGTKIILNRDVEEGSYNIPNNITLDTKNISVADNVKINITNPDNVELKENEVLVKNEDNTYSIVTKTQDVNKEPVQEETKPNQETSKNPKTSDSLIRTIILELISLLGLGYTVNYIKKLKNN